MLFGEPGRNGRSGAGLIHSQQANVITALVPLHRRASRFRQIDCGAAEHR